MEEEPKTSTYYDEFKYGGDEEYMEDMEQDGPPSLAPPAPISHYRLANTNFSNSGNYVNGIGDDSHSSRLPYSSVEKYNEEVTMRFLFGNGRPLSTIDDEHFQHFLKCLSGTRNPPEAASLMAKAATEHKPNIKYQRNVGPLCITIEAMRHTNEVFLAISVHFYTQAGERQNTVHFDKVIAPDYEGKVVADRIRRIIDTNKIYNFGVSYIVSPNIRMLKLLAQNMPINNTFVCFSSYLANIARDVIQLPIFQNSLKVLRTYVESLHNQQEVYLLFKQIQIQEDDSIDIPRLDSPNEWLTTLHFLSVCNRLHSKFLEFKENWRLPSYLDTKQENAIAQLYEFLSVLCSIASQVCSEDSCISQIYYSLSIINNGIQGCTIRSARNEMLKIFTTYYTGIVNGKGGNKYAICSLLDPRYGYSSIIFNDDDWLNVEEKLLKEAGEMTISSIEIHKEIDRYKAFLNDLPAFDEVMTPVIWWNERRHELPAMYRLWIEYSTVPAVSIDAKRLFSKSGKFGYLFSTLDEEMNFKALLLAQSSQEFIGRGNESRIVQSQIDLYELQFAKLEEEEAEEEEEMEVKQEVIEDDASEAVVEAKEEIIEEENTTES